MSQMKELLNYILPSRVKYKRHKGRVPDGMMVGKILKYAG